jgi:hypothetical protein
LRSRRAILEIRLASISSGQEIYFNGEDYTGKWMAGSSSDYLKITENKKLYRNLTYTSVN